MRKKHHDCHNQTQTNFQPQINNYLPQVNQFVIDKSIFLNCEVLMISDNSFIMIHHKEQIFMVDQHAACEKVLYMENYEKSKRQRDKRPTKENIAYKIPNIYKTLLVQNEKQINQLGWEYKIIGNSKGVYVSVDVFQEPYILTDTLGQNELIYYLEQMYENQGKKWQVKWKYIDLSQKEKEIIADYACHRSYRFGQKISLQKAQEIIRKLAWIQAPFNCPHSRILISYYGNAKQLGLL